MTPVAVISSKCLPLAGFHRRLGAEFGVLPEGLEVPLQYGSIAEEHAALSSGCALVDRSWVGRLELLGEDRQRFLHGLVTCDVKALGPREGAYGFLTSAQGRVLADLAVLAFADRLWLELPPGRDGAVAEHLRKYLLTDRVEVLPLEDMLPLTLIGPRLAEALPELAAVPEGLRRHARVAVAGTEVALVREERFGLPAATLWVSASIAKLLAESLLDRDGVRSAGFAALEALRVESAVPRFGPDFGPDHFPQETGLEEQAVSYTKGCYLGQEVVARIHYRGQAQRVLRVLRFTGAEPPASSTPLLHDGREAGTVGSAVRSLATGAVVGLAVLHRRAAEPGTRLELPDGGHAEVAASPLAS